MGILDKLDKLEKTDYPTHSIDLPFNKTNIIIRSWNMKEHKILIMAFESKSQADIQRAMLQVLQNITVDGTIVAKLPAIDVDYLFLQARCQSVSHIVPISLTEKETGETVKYPLDLSKIQMKPDENRKYMIPLLSSEGKETGVFFKMKDLTAGDRLEIEMMKEKDNSMVEEIEIAVRCIESIGDETDISNICDDPKLQKKVRKILEGMAPVQYVSIDEFVSTLPIINYDLDIDKVFPNGKGKLHFEGIEDFFD